MNLKHVLAVTLMILTTTVMGNEFRLPEFETTKLQNGLTLYLMERHQVPLIAIRAVVKAGAVDDEKQAGLANLTVEALLLGSRKHSKDEIEQAFDFRGAQIASVGDVEDSSLVADFAKDDAAILLPIFAEVLQHPTFNVEEVNKLRTRTVDSLKQARESPREIISEYYNSMLFGVAAYGNPVSGTVSSVSVLQPEDMQHFYQQHYRPDNTALVVVGDFDSSKMRKQLDTLFGKWSSAKGDMLKARENGKVQAEKARVWLVNKSDATETTFLFGGAGIARNDPDYVPLQVINTILGGRFTSWLNDELRVNSGLTYGARSAFNTHSQTGTFAISSFTATEKTEAALALATQTYQRLWNKEIDAATLDSAKAYVKGQYPPRFETNQQLSDLLGDMFVYQIGRDRIDHFMQDVDSLRPERAREIINKHFPREKLQMVLIGKAETIRPFAAKYGEVTELEITADGFVPEKEK